jgi:predicted dienelactone hydrolase
MTDSQTAAGRIRLWERARDVSFVLDRILADSTWASHIDRDRIAFVGHSMGGWTGVALAGGVYDWQGQLAACRAMKSRDYYCREGAMADATADVPLEGNATSAADPRIRSYVLLAPGPSGGFTSDSLAAIRVPVWVVSADYDDVTSDAERLAGTIPAARATRLPTDHFAFIPRCNWLGKLRLGFLCSTSGDQRESVHSTVAEGVVAFFKQTLATPAK